MKVSETPQANIKGHEGHFECRQATQNKDRMHNNQKPIGYKILRLHLCRPCIPT